MNTSDAILPPNVGWGGVGIQVATDDAEEQLSGLHLAGERGCSPLFMVVAGREVSQVRLSF